MAPEQFRRALVEDRDSKLYNVLIGALGLFLGCCVAHVVDEVPAVYPGHPWQRTILIDSAFSAAETGHVMIGCGSWVEAAGPRNVELSFDHVDHAQGVITVPPEGTIQFLRYGSMAEVSRLCSASNKLAVACWRADLRTVLMSGEAIRPEQFEMVSAHELGHAMGLGHCPGKSRPHCSLPSVLGEYTNDMSEKPTDVDVRDFCRRNGCIK